MTTKAAKTLRSRLLRVRRSKDEKIINGETVIMPVRSMMGMELVTHGPGEVVLTWPESIPRSQFNRDFLQGMLNRVAMSYHTYGDSKNNRGKVNWLASLRMRLAKYRKTHNTEYLIDAANYAMLEFMYPNDRRAFFKATDSSGSPGAKLLTGDVAHTKEEIY
jgi:hypothetical protein